MQRRLLDYRIVIERPIKDGWVASNNIKNYWKTVNCKHINILKNMGIHTVDYYKGLSGAAART